MADENSTASGGCLCGKIRFEVQGDPVGAGYCHCRSCRKQTGAPLAAFAVFRTDQVTWISGERARYESSPGVFRSFCPVCGSTLALEAVYGGVDLTEFHISALDEPDAFPPNEHTHYKEKIPWLHVADDLKKYPGSMM
ncbi:GFA family protein [Hwanghaeella grinnelliae]|uniref:GFA family protein n=1 Tax=Hwanghaeella grinnelliae TaxID=2500179 RepID=A0A3S2W8S9_9PROT|nr:GFA family protein [Hwanghaeella grinnelliae]RVU36012.1 GFA family protein [Hwanghaeella grinnelliae]